MVMPLRDDDTDRHTVPVVTYALIAANILVWLIELSPSSHGSFLSLKQSSAAVRSG